VNLRDRIKKILIESSQDENSDEELTLYKSLKMWVRGKISEYDLEESDGMLNDVKHKSGHPGLALMVFDLDNDSRLFELLNLGEDDGYFARAVTSTYGDGWDFQDSYNIEDDFKEGYIVFGDLDAENIEKLEDIGYLLTGKKINLQGGPEELGNFSRLLLDTFPDEMDSILTSYRIEKDIEMNRAAKDSVESEINDFLERIGFSVYRNFDLISTTPSNLIMWYARIGDTSLTFEELFEKIIENTDTGRNELGGGIDNQYEFTNSSLFDEKSFNRDAEFQIDKILDSLNDETTNIDDFRNMIDSVTKNYKLGIWYNIPKDKDYMFKVDSFDKNEMKIKIKVRKGRGWLEELFSFTLEGLNNFLNHPDLFGLSDLIREY
jgi:hypothetical protein